jgi:hypothetical protein
MTFFIGLGFGVLLTIGTALIAAGDKNNIDDYTDFH